MAGCGLPREGFQMVRLVRQVFYSSSGPAGVLASGENYVMVPTVP
jgi:hypothetical protein